MSIADELQKLQQLHQSGAINDAEFAAAKAEVLGGEATEPPVTEAPPIIGGTPANVKQQTQQWAFFLHLSVLAGLLVPLAGVVVPILIWQLKKDELPGLGAHGKNAVNWIISGVIYAMVGVVLTMVIIGLPLLIVLSVLWIIFPIVAAIKANNGVVWEYPFSIRVLK
jgi:uncharacterized Tic20 family protein